MKAVHLIRFFPGLVLFGLTGVACHAEVLGTYSFSGAEPGDTSGFPVEDPHEGLVFGPLQTKWQSIGVVTAFAADEAHSAEPFASYSFDGKGYAVSLVELNQGDNPPPSVDFMQFTIQPKSGKQLELESISIDFGSDFTTTFQPDLFYNLWYSINGKDYFRIGQPSELKTNSHVYKIRDDVRKVFQQYRDAVYDGQSKIIFRLAFRDGKGSGSAEKRLFIDDIKIHGNVE